MLVVFHRWMEERKLEFSFKNCYSCKVLSLDLAIRDGLQEAGISLYRLCFLSNAELVDHVLDVLQGIVQFY